MDGAACSQTGQPEARQFATVGNAMRVAGWRHWRDFYDRHLPPGAFTRPRLSISWPCVSAAALALLATTVWALQHDGSIQIAGHPRIIDGDTIAFGRMHVRLYGIAAPE